MSGGKATSRSCIWRSRSKSPCVVARRSHPRILLISPQGSVLRVANNSRTVSTEGLPSGVLIATAAYGGKTITRKFIIK
ncbi:MAG: T9SS type A sorting domain-containing protein [Bacteroidaceae bacterium]|nr:T9SS type A sorting domain-containing protein [Bacteroidaceae bacterium]